MGRRKVEMKKITDKNSRFVTFSKRRSGMFKKAAEIATLCGVEVATIVFSPTGKPFSFGEPSARDVTDRFLDEEEGRSGAARRTGAGSATDPAETRELGEQLERLSEQVKIEKEKEKRLKRAMAAEENPTAELRVGELCMLKARLEKIREAVSKGIAENESDASDTLLLLSNSGADAEAS